MSDEGEQPRYLALAQQLGINIPVPANIRSPHRERKREADALRLFYALATQGYIAIIRATSTEEFEGFNYYPLANLAQKNVTRKEANEFIRLMSKVLTMFYGRRTEQSEPERAISPLSLAALGILRINVVEDYRSACLTHAATAAIVKDPVARIIFNHHINLFDGHGRIASDIDNSAHCSWKSLLRNGKK